MTFVIFHGSFGNPEENWFPQLKTSLQDIDQSVIVPRFPVDDWDELTNRGKGVKSSQQTLNNWLKAFEPYYKEIRENKSICFVAHSLGPQFALHVVDTWNIQLDSAIFVAPFSEPIGDIWQFQHVNHTFYKTSFDYKKLQTLIPTSYVLYSDNDPYVPMQCSTDFAERLHASKILVKKGGHLNSEVGLSTFPLVYELCISRLDYPASVGQNI